MANLAGASSKTSSSPSLASSGSVKDAKQQVVDSSHSTLDLVDEDDPPPRIATAFLYRNEKRYQPDAIATRRSVFDDPVLAQHYWPKSDYENLHRFDPKARWTQREERSLVSKIDWRVMFWACISFTALNLDRNNLSQANTDNILPDLGMTTDDYNLGNTLFRLCFLIAELPSQLVSKRLGPDRWIPMQMCAWSVVTICQFWLNGRSSFLACRALLGFIQGGFIPDLILYLSYFYTKNELPLRLAFFWISSNVCTILASFLAFGVLRLRGHQGKEGWRWLFLVEGLITLTIGIATFFMMPPSPTQTKTWYRPKGWFTDREETIVVTRVLRDDPTKGDMHNREGISVKRLWQAACDYDLWPLYIIGVMFGLPTGPPQSYLTLSLRNLGFSTLQTNLLSIPAYVGGMITMYAVTFVSELVNERTLVSMAEDLWTLPFLVALYALPPNPNPWVFFGLATGLLAFPYTHPIQVAWASRNAGAVASRTVNASIYNMCVQASAIIYAQVYRKDDAPRYRRGNAALISICLVNLCVIYPGTKLYYMWRNKQRAKIWDKMTSEEKAEYLRTTTDIGNRRLDFRFAH